MILEKREQSESNYALKVGIGEFKVVAVNPTLKELQVLLDTDKIDKDPVYVETKDGKDRVSIVFWVEDVKTGQKYPHRFYVTNEPKVWEKSGKSVFINQTGATATVLDEKDLQSWFTKFSDKDKNEIGDKNYRKALVGEAELYQFLTKWISQVSYFSPTTDVMLDNKKLFRSNFSELKDLVTSELVGTVVLALYVAIVDKDGEKKYYQNIWKEAGAGYLIKKFNLSIQTNSWSADKDSKKFHDALMGEYGITRGGSNAFKLGHLEDFNAEDYLNATDAVISHDNSATIEDTDY